MRSRKWKIIGLILATIPLVIAYNWYVLVFESIPEMYCAEWVAGTIVDHMKANDGRWPKNWEELHQTFADRTAEKGSPWKFEELRRRVDVDFSAEPQVLSQLPLRGKEPPFRVITLRSGRRHHWESMEPNTMVWRYLQSAREEHSQNAVAPNQNTGMASPVL